MYDEVSIVTYQILHYNMFW